MDSTLELWTDDDLEPIWSFFLSYHRHPRNSRSWGLDRAMASVLQAERRAIDGRYLSCGPAVLVLCRWYLAHLVCTCVSQLVSMDLRRLRFVTGSLLCLAAKKAVHACAVCSVTNEASRYAYYGTTVFLTLLPLFMIGGVVYYIAKKGR